MYITKETLSQALLDLKGTAHPLLKVWLTLKAMGLEADNPVLIDTKNSTETLKLLFHSGDPNGRFYIPFSPTPSDEWMKGDASRSIIQTTIKKWFDGTITTVDPRSYLTITKSDRKYKIELAPVYPQGLGEGQNGFSRSAGQMLAVPVVQFAVWVFCREAIPDGTTNIAEYLCSKLRTLLHLSSAEESRVFKEVPFAISTSEEALTDANIFQLCGGSTEMSNVNCGWCDEYLAAIRTKPFILLAGISGTGKSRLVRQLARGCCPKVKAEDGDHPLYDEGKSGNFEMIQVRPNWHDSSELMGYVSRIVKAGDPPKYVMMPFVEFLAKAWVYREVPFFLCLDEMNLAPLEQYFAEYLSVIETRKKQTLGPEGATFEAISTDPLIRWESLEKDTLKNAVKDLFENKEWAAKAEHGRVEEIEKLILHDKGIRIPPNLVVMGTVNMDETTCSFSRKVLDRAMSFELNDVADMYDPTKLDAETESEFGKIPATAAEPKLLTGKEAYDSTAGQAVAIAADGTKVGDAILKILEVLNEKNVPAKKDDGTDDTGTMPLLAKTPFKIAYRTRNEIMIYCVERISNGLVELPQALDEAISMKILSRIEGDSQHVQKKWLVTLSAAIESELSKLDGYDAAKCALCKSKLADMADQADYGYTSFWTR